MIVLVVYEGSFVVLAIELPETHVFQSHCPDIVHKMITHIAQEKTVDAVNLSYMVTNAMFHVRFGDTVTYSVYDDYPMGSVDLGTAFLFTEFVTSSNRYVANFSPVRIYCATLLTAD